MPEADTFDAPQGKAFHGILTGAITEAFVGNGVLANGEGEVTSGSGSMETDVSAATTGISYSGTVYTPIAATFTHSNGPTTTTNSQDDRRVDIIYFDESTAAYAKAEGTADPNPTPPTLPADALLLAVVLIEHGQTSNLTNDQILNWRARPVAGKTAGNNEAEFAQGLHVGHSVDRTITETSTPTGFTFTAGDDADVHLETDVTISNNSGADATEDVTVTLYDGTDSGGTQLVTETKSVTVTDGGTVTETFITTDQQLDGGDYFVEVTTSGTDLSIDQTDEKTEAAEWSANETDDGTLQVINRYTGTVVLEFDLFTDKPTFVNDAITAVEVASDVTLDVVRGHGNTISGQLAGLGTNPGAFGLLIDATVDSSPAAGTAQSYGFGVDATSIFEIYAEADGAGAIQNARAQLQKDLFDAVNAKTAYSISAGHVPRAAIDDFRETAGIKTSAYSTAGEEVVPFDSSGGSFTITVSTADMQMGAFMVFADVAGSAGTNAVTIDTEGSETIDGATSESIDTDFGALIIFSPDGNEWITTSTAGVDAEDDGTIVAKAAGAINWRRLLDVTDDGDGTVTVDVGHADVFEGRESGSVSAGNQGILCIGNLPVDETVEVYRAALTTADGQAVATSVDLKLVTLDNAGGFTTQATLITGDGSTVFDDETGSPLDSYTNTTTAAETIAILVDNGTTASVSIMAEAEGLTGQ